MKLQTLKQYYDIQTIAWFLLAGAIVWRISQILECFRDFLVNFNMTCVKFAAWAPNEYNNWKEAWKSEIGRAHV